MVYREGKQKTQVHFERFCLLVVGWVHCDQSGIEKKKIFILPALLFTWLLWSILLPITFWEKFVVIIAGLALGLFTSLTIIATLGMAASE